VIVADTNLISYLWIPGVKTQLAEMVMAKDPVWIAPILWRSEFQNVLAGCLRRKDLNLSQVFRILDSAENYFKGNEYVISSQEVMKLIEKSECSAYDCEFVCLAISKNIPLVTNDKKILENFPKVAFKPDEFTS